MIDNELVRAYEAYFDLFSREGWKLLIEDLESMVEGLDSLDYVDSIEKLHYHKGQLAILRRLIGMKAAMEAAYEDLDSDPSDWD